jgi:DNA-binding NarL/FixJ family response regulator
MGQQGNLHVLIVAPPSRLRDGLRAVVQAMPQVASIDQADDLNSALGMLAEQHPAWVLLDGDLLTGDIGAALRQLEVAGPMAWRIVLTNDAKLRRAVQASGAHMALAKSVTTKSLSALTAALLETKGATPVL